MKKRVFSPSLHSLNQCELFSGYVNATKAPTPELISLAPRLDGTSWFIFQCNLPHQWAGHINVMYQLVQLSSVAPWPNRPLMTFQFEIHKNRGVTVCLCGFYGELVRICVSCLKKWYDGMWECLKIEECLECLKSAFLCVWNKTKL